MTISMATNAHGAAATTLIFAPWSSGALFRKCSETHRTPHDANETPRSRSASVSWRRLSCQNTTATATYNKEDGMTAETEIVCAALAAAQSPSKTPTNTAGIFQGFRWE